MFIEQVYAADYAFFFHKYAAEKRERTTGCYTLKWMDTGPMFTSLRFHCYTAIVTPTVSHPQWLCGAYMPPNLQFGVWHLKLWA